MPYIRKRCKCEDQQKCEHSWYYTIDIGKDLITGNRKQKSVGGFKTEKDALREGLKEEEKVQRGIVVTSPKLKDYITMYMENQVKHNVTDATYVNQMNLVEKHIIPYIGELNMARVKYEDVERYYARLLKEGLQRGLIRNISMVLRKVFRAAESRDVIHKNIVSNVRAPRYKPATMNIWTTQQVQDFFQRGTHLPYYPIYALALTTGMRIGEILGLQWEDVNWMTGKLSITRMLKYDPVNKRHLKGLKNDNSKRSITLPEFSLNVLREHKANSLPSPYIFHRAGELHYPVEVSRQFTIDSKRLGMPKIRFHDIRHTHASLLLQEGYNPKVVAERLGHGSVLTLLNTYAHVLPTMEEEVAAGLDRMFDGNSEGVDIE